MQARRLSRGTVCSVTLCLAVLAVSFLLAAFGSQGAATIAFEIFMISAIGFSGIAWFSYRAVVFWRSVDFPWILTSFAAIVVSLVNISANDAKQYRSTAGSEIARAFSDLTYVTRSIIINDCETQRSGQETPPAPEPFSGACDQMKHFLPQMIYVSERTEDRINVDELTGWGRKLTTAPNPKLIGAWKEQAAAARTLIKTIDRYAPGLQRIEGAPRDRIENFILSTKLKLWYFVMAFFVGLRLSKTTAEVLQARSTRAAPRGSPV